MHNLLNNSQSFFVKIRDRLDHLKYNRPEYINPLMFENWNLSHFDFVEFLNILKLSENQRNQLFNFAVFTNCSLQYANMQIELENVKFENTNLQDTRMYYMTKCVMQNCTFNYSIFRKGGIVDCKINKCDFENTLIYKVLITKNQITESQFTGVQFDDCDFARNIFYNCKGIYHSRFDDRGYEFVATIVDGQIRICAGCRKFSVKEAIDHWGNEYYKDIGRGMLYVETIGLAENALLNMPFDYSSAISKNGN